LQKQGGCRFRRRFGPRSACRAFLSTRRATEGRRKVVPKWRQAVDVCDHCVPVRQTDLLVAAAATGKGRPTSRRASSLAPRGQWPCRRQDHRRPATPNVWSLRSGASFRLQHPGSDMARAAVPGQRTTGAPVVLSNAPHFGAGSRRQGGTLRGRRTRISFPRGSREPQSPSGSPASHRKTTDPAHAPSGRSQLVPAREFEPCCGRWMAFDGDPPRTAEHPEQENASALMRRRGIAKKHEGAPAAGPSIFNCDGDLRGQPVGPVRSIRCCAYPPEDLTIKDRGRCPVRSSRLHFCDPWQPVARSRRPHLSGKVRLLMGCLVLGLGLANSWARCSTVVTAVVRGHAFMAAFGAGACLQIALRLNSRIWLGRKSGKWR